MWFLVSCNDLVRTLCWAWKKEYRLEVRDHLRNLKVHKFTGPDQVHASGPEGTGNEVAMPLPIIF